MWNAHTRPFQHNTTQQSQSSSPRSPPSHTDQHNAYEYDGSKLVIQNAKFSSQVGFQTPKPTDAQHGNSQAQDSHDYYYYYYF